MPKGKEIALPQSKLNLVPPSAELPGNLAGRRTRETNQELIEDPELLDFRIRETICQMVMWGTPPDDIALLMRLTPQALTEKYGHELATGKRQMEVNLGGRLYDIAMSSGDHSASIRATTILLQNKAGWQPPVKAGGGINAPGGTVNIKAVQFVLPERATPEQWAHLVAKATEESTIDPDTVVLDIPKK
jgi:hypothetical protein